MSSIKFLLAAVTILILQSIGARQEMEGRGLLDNNLDSIKMATTKACVILHHPQKKLSLVVKQINSKVQLDSIFKYVGVASDDTSCLQGGCYNTFGQIDLFKDSIFGEKTGEIHVVIQGVCSGFYLRTKDGLKKYEMNDDGKRFLRELYARNKGLLK